MQRVRHIHISSLIITLLLLLAADMNAFAQQERIGWLDISCDTKSCGAEVWLDKEFLGYAPAVFEIKSGKHTISLKKDFCTPFTASVIINANEVFALPASLEAHYTDCELYSENQADIYIDSLYVGRGVWKGPIPYGEHIIQCFSEGHTPSSITVNVSQETDPIILLPAPSPILGTVSITSSVHGAKVSIDGQFIGVTPITLENAIPIGKRKVNIYKENHIIFSQELIITENEVAQLHADLEEFSDVNIASSPNEAQISINGEIVGETPCTATLLLGDYNIEVHKKNYRTYNGTLNVTSNCPDTFIKLKRQYFKNTSVYIAGQYQFLGYNAVKLSIGGYLKGINIEANACFGLSPSESIFWNVPNTMTQPYEYQYTPTYIGGKLGYGIILGTRLRISPQIGLGILKLTGECINEGDNRYNPRATDGYSIPLSAAMKIEFACLPHVSLCITPEYQKSIMQSALYRQLIGASKQIEQYSNNVSISAGINIYF